MMLLMLGTVGTCGSKTHELMHTFFTFSACQNASAELSSDKHFHYSSQWRKAGRDDKETYNECLQTDIQQLSENRKIIIPFAFSEKESGGARAGQKSVNFEI